MDCVDIESFRSKYSDLTVTTVPSCSKRNNDQQPAIEQEEAKMTAKPQEPRVEITRIGATAPASQVMTTRHRTQQSAAALAYANEYKEVMAKLEYTKYMQAQLQLVILANGTNGDGGAGFNGNLFGMLSTSITVDENSNIEDKYSDLLNVLADIQPNLAPTMMGVRTRKDRILRDIDQARVMVRECILILERDQQQTESTQTQGSPTSE